jgi:hypothetical protein
MHQERTWNPSQNLLLKFSRMIQKQPDPMEQITCGVMDDIEHCTIPGMKYGP